MSEKMIDPNELGEKVVKVLKTIYDPEVEMTLTSPNCPVAESLPQEVKDKVADIKGVKSAEIEMTFEPPWTKDLMSEEAKLELGFL